MIYTGILALVVLLTSLVLWHEYERTRPSGAEGELKRIDMPQEASEAVARFAWLCGMTRDKLKIMGVLCDDYFSEAVPAFTFGGAGEDARAEFSFCFDWSMEGFHALMGYELGEGLHVEDRERVVFSTDRMTGLDGESPEALAARMAEVFRRECPDAVVSDVRHMPHGMTILAKFQ